MKIESFTVCPVNIFYFEISPNTDFSIFFGGEHALNHPTLGSVRMFEELNRSFFIVSLVLFLEITP